MLHLEVLASARDRDPLPGIAADDRLCYAGDGFEKPEIADPAWRPRVNAALEAHATQATITQHVGVRPEKCMIVDPSSWLCEWRLSDREVGWEPLAKALETHSRVSLICEFPTDGTLRANNACSARPARSNQLQFRPASYPSDRGYEPADMRTKLR